MNHKIDQLQPQANELKIPLVERKKSATCIQIISSLIVFLLFNK